MNYLLDKKIKKRKIYKISGAIVVLILVIYFHTGIFNGLSTAAHFVFRPVIVLGNNLGNKLSSIGVYFKSKEALSIENENLKAQILADEAARANFTTTIDENNKMKEILGNKKVTADFILAGILSKPNQSLYDTLLIDRGVKEGIAIGKKVFALGNIPIGYIGEVYGNSAKVILFSSPGERTEVVINGKAVFMTAVGRGGGNFEMVLPRDFVLDIGTEIDLPGIDVHVLGTVQTIISDPRDSFQKALLASPVSIQELKFVEVEK